MGAETRTPLAAAEAPQQVEPETREVSPAARRRSIGPYLALASVVVVAAALYAGAAQLVSTPRVHPDEHLYGGAGASLAEGDGLTVRGESYSLGALYPAVLATVLSVFPDRETGYHLSKVANGLLFALAAVPIFFLARRLLSTWWSVGVAALAVAIPSSMYVSVVMTESASYLVYSIAVLAIVLALERPSPGRQLAAIAAIGLAYSARAQFALLFAAYLLGLLIVWTISRDRQHPREALARLWPSLGVAVLGAVVLIGRPLVTGASPLESLGAYGVLFRGYDPLDIAKWGAYHLADLELYLAVVPIAVAPIVLWELWRRGRAGSERAAAFVAAFLAINAGMLFVTAAFASTPFGFDRLHDRNIFYLAPFWLIALGVWLAEGMPRPLAATAGGVGLALVLPAILPFGYIASDVGVDVVPSAFWARVQDSLAGEPITGRKLLVIVVVGLVVAAAALPRRFRWAFPGAVLATFAVTGVLAWERMIDAPENAVFEKDASRSWVDDRLPEDARVTKLYLVNNSCPASALTWHALYLTEYFNASVERAAYIDESIPDGLPIDQVNVAGDGRFMLPSREPLVADYVYTQPGIELVGRRLATGTAAHLVLWETLGEVKAVGARANADLQPAECAS